MRILFNSRDTQFKNPFGTLLPGQSCSLCIHIPEDVGAKKVVCVLERCDGGEGQEVQLRFSRQLGRYDHFCGSFSIKEPGLYFYYFRIHKENGSFRLFKQGEDTNMEAGDRWQVSCVPDYAIPEWAQGSVMYQVFPDRFHKSGECDLSGKLEPYIVHENWDEEVVWRPDGQGKVLNNDFYGGNFRGITEKLPYLAELGTTVLYLNPISKSFSSHRYDTGDYMQPDPMLGTMEDFRALCDAAHELGIRVILDGVYSHTGDNSLYFNRPKSFGEGGAYWEKDSQFRSWYRFKEDGSYDSWWGFDTLPTVNKLDPGFVDYIITGGNSVIAHWLNAGCDGFRLDVADELPNEFLKILKNRLRQLRPDGLLLGEVWEDASNKVAYGEYRRYFVDAELDSVMNYPFRNAILAFLRGEDDGRNLRETVLTLAENYPAGVLHASMSLLSTHDSPRILSALMGWGEESREELAVQNLSPEEYQCAKERLLAAAFLQYMLPGMPSIYYGDEAGMEGGKDPFNRRTYPWGREDTDLVEHYRRLGQLRKERESLRRGDIRFFQAGGGRLGFCRSLDGKMLRIYVNLSDAAWEVPGGKLLLGYKHRVVAPNWVTLEKMGFCVTED